MKRLLAFATTVTLTVALALVGTVSAAIADEEVATDTLAAVVEAPPAPTVAATAEITPSEDPAPASIEPAVEVQAAPADAAVEEPVTDPSAEEVVPAEDGTAEEGTVEKAVDDGTVPEEGEALDEPAEAEAALVAEDAVAPEARMAVVLLVEDPVKKVTFCHATASESNPYVRISTSVSAFFMAGHDTHQDFEDIVPPFSYVKQGQLINFPGLNWGPDSQVFVDNGCADSVPLIASATVELVAPTCLAGELLILGDTAGTHASWVVDTDLEGPLANYEVVSEADDGYVFPAGAGVSMDGSTKTFTGSLAGPLDPESAECTELLVATASVERVPATCGAGELLIPGPTAGTHAAWVDPAVLEGPLDYEVTSVADDNALFEPGEGVSMDGTTKVFTGTLAGPLSPESPDCQVTPTVTSTPLTCTAAGSYTIGGENVIWTIEGEEIDPGVHPVTVAGTIELVASAVKPFSIDPEDVDHELVFAQPTGCSTPAGLASTGSTPAPFLGGAILLLLGGLAMVGRARRSHS